MKNGNQFLVPQAPAPGVFALPAPPERVYETRFVSFRHTPRDWQVPFLTMFGFTAAAVGAVTGLSVGAVRYRLAKLNRGRAEFEKVSATNYRNGISPIAKMVVAASGPKVKPMLSSIVASQIQTVRINGQTIDI
jgi:hypothetical protein